VKHIPRKWGAKTRKKRSAPTKRQKKKRQRWARETELPLEEYPRRVGRVTLAKEKFVTRGIPETAGLKETVRYKDREDVSKTIHRLKKRAVRTGDKI